MTTITESDPFLARGIHPEAAPLTEVEQQQWAGIVEQLHELNTDIESVRHQAAGSVAIERYDSEHPDNSEVSHGFTAADQLRRLTKEKADRIEAFLGAKPGEAVILEMRGLAQLYEGRTDTWRLADGTAITWFGTRADHNLTIQEEYFMITQPNGSLRYGLIEKRATERVFYDISDDGTVTMARHPLRGVDAGRAFVSREKQGLGSDQIRRKLAQTVDNTLATAGIVQGRSEDVNVAADADAKLLYRDVSGWRALKSAQSFADVESYIAEQYRTDNDAPGRPIRLADANHLADVAIADRH